MGHSVGVRGRGRRRCRKEIVNVPRIEACAKTAQFCGEPAKASDTSSGAAARVSVNQTVRDFRRFGIPKAVEFNTCVAGTAEYDPWQKKVR